MAVGLIALLMALVSQHSEGGFGIYIILFYADFPAFAPAYLLSSAIGETTMLGIAVFAIGLLALNFAVGAILGWIYSRFPLRSSFKNKQRWVLALCGLLWIMVFFIPNSDNGFWYHAVRSSLGRPIFLFVGLFQPITFCLSFLFYKWSTPTSILVIGRFIDGVLFGVLLVYIKDQLVLIKNRFLNEAIK